MKLLSFIFSVVFATPLLAQNAINGQVLVQENNETYPLEGVAVFWLNTQEGTVTNAEGAFTLDRVSSTNQLVFKYLGFTTDTLTVESDKKIFHFMKEDQGERLEGVELTQRKKALQKSYLEAQNIMKVNSEELLKAACCNLSESFETNPSIDVNFSDALTGTKQIKMLGLSSPYLLITEENIPSVRGASQIYGLTYTPGTWIESIQITKGAGSVTNGFESIAGQINTELQKPFTDVPLFANLFASINGRQEANFHWNKKMSPKWSTGLYLHANQRQLVTDQNNDDFLDLPLAKQVNLLSRWQYTDAEKGWVSFASIRFLDDQKQTGSVDFDPTTNRGSSSLWGSEIQTQRFDASVKAGYVFPLLTYQSFGFQAEKFVRAVKIAQLEHYRAVTHNKGIMNGVDAVVIATGNDFRAVEAGAHAYAARQGQYGSLSKAFIEGDEFCFELELPLAIGTVGGLTKLHPLVKWSMELLGNPSAKELMQIIAVAGLAQNFAAVRSLVTSGIQKGHMKMHLLNILNQLNANDSQKEKAIEYFKTTAVSYSAVENFLQSV